MVTLTGGAVSQVAGWPWAMIGVGVTAVVLGVTVWVHFARPWRRHKALTHPCDPYFHITALKDGKPLGYLEQDNQAHILKELVLPANSEVELEIAYYPKINFHVNETVIGFVGDDLERKPEILTPIDPFVVKGTVSQPDAYWDRKGYFHYSPRAAGRSIGSCYTRGFRVKTKWPGTYDVYIGFLTNEVDGSAQLNVRVEDHPTTTMTCCISEHGKCLIKPKTS